MDGDEASDIEEEDEGNDGDHIRYNDKNDGSEENDITRNLSHPPSHSATFATLHEHRNGFQIQTAALGFALVTKVSWPNDAWFKCLFGGQYRCTHGPPTTSFVSERSGTCGRSVPFLIKAKADEDRDWWTFVTTDTMVQPSDSPEGPPRHSSADVSHS